MYFRSQPMKKLQSMIINASLIIYHSRYFHRDFFSKSDFYDGKSDYHHFFLQNQQMATFGTDNCWVAFLSFFSDLRKKKNISDLSVLNFHRIFFRSQTMKKLQSMIINASLIIYQQRYFHWDFFSKSDFYDGKSDYHHSFFWGIPQITHIMFEIRVIVLTFFFAKINKRLKKEWFSSTMIHLNHFVASTTLFSVICWFLQRKKWWQSLLIQTLYQWFVEFRKKMCDDNHCYFKHYISDLWISAKKWVMIIKHYYSHFFEW